MFRGIACMEFDELEERLGRTLDPDKWVRCVRGGAWRHVDSVVFDDADCHDAAIIHASARIPYFAKVYQDAQVFGDLACAGVFVRGEAVVAETARIVVPSLVHCDRLVGELTGFETVHGWYVGWSSTQHIHIGCECWTYPEWEELMHERCVRHLVTDYETELLTLVRQVANSKNPFEVL